MNVVSRSSTKSYPDFLFGILWFLLLVETGNIHARISQVQRAEKPDGERLEQPGQYHPSPHPLYHCREAEKMSQKIREKQQRHLLTSLIVKKAKFSPRKESHPFISRLITLF